MSHSAPVDICYHEVVFMPWGKFGKFPFFKEYLFTAPIGVLAGSWGGKIGPGWAKTPYGKFI